MKLYYPDRILDRGSEQLPAGFVGVAIHPSSDVDVVDVDGARLAPRSVVPIDPTTRATVKAVRRRIDVNAFPGAPGVGDSLEITPDYTPQKLVLQLYEKCDQLIPPGPRTPYYRDILIPSADLSAVALTANLALVIPFWGRSTLQLSVKRTDTTQDLSFFIVGRKHGNRDSASPKPIFSALASFGDEDGVLDESGVFTWGMPTFTLDPTLPRWRTVYFGGLGDAGECFDYLLVFCYGAAGGGDALLVAEAYGEVVGG